MLVLIYLLRINRKTIKVPTKFENIYWYSCFFKIVKKKTVCYVFQLFLHSPADIPIDLQPSAYVNGNSMLSISSKIDVIRASLEVMKWAPKIRNCYFQHENFLKFFKIYTNNNCRVECRANKTLNECGCNAFYQPSKNLNNLIISRRLTFL